MKKKILLFAAIAVFALAALTACGAKVSIDSIKEAFVDAGYTASTPSSETGTVASMGAIKGTTVVAVYEYEKESDANNMVSITELGASISKAKVSKKGKVFVCVAIDVLDESSATAAINIFNGCF